MFKAKCSSTSFLLSSVALCLIVSLGCNQPKPGRVAKPPLVANFSEGVDKAQKLTEEIKAAFDAGSPHDADGALHTAVELLSSLPAMAASEGKLDEATLASVKDACKSAFDQFGILHDGFHGHPGEESEEGHAHDTSSVFETLNKALADLKSATGGAE